jgi:hypothetical protein
MNQDDPFYDVFYWGPSLDCVAHIEANFNALKKQPTRVQLCCHCAGEFDSPVEFNYYLKAPHGPYYYMMCSLLVRCALTMDATSLYTELDEMHKLSKTSWMFKQQERLAVKHMPWHVKTSQRMRKRIRQRRSKFASAMLPCIPTCIIE